MTCDARRPRRTRSATKGATVANDEDTHGNVLRGQGYAQFVGDKWTSLNERNPDVIILNVKGEPSSRWEPRQTRDVFDVRLAQRSQR